MLGVFTEFLWMMDLIDHLFPGVLCSMHKDVLSTLGSHIIIDWVWHPLAISLDAMSAAKFKQCIRHWLSVTSTFLYMHLSKIYLQYAISHFVTHSWQMHKMQALPKSLPTINRLHSSCTQCSSHGVLTHFTLTRQVAIIVSVKNYALHGQLWVSFCIVEVYYIRIYPSRHIVNRWCDLMKFCSWLFIAHHCDLVTFTHLITNALISKKNLPFEYRVMWTQK